MTIGIVSQKHQIVADLTGDLPQPLPLLPVVPAGEPCRAEDNNQRNGNQSFDKRKAMLFFMPGVWRNAVNMTSRNSGFTRRYPENVIRCSALHADWITPRNRVQTKKTGA